jgi:hypothetical protein
MDGLAIRLLGCGHLPLQLNRCFRRELLLNAL